MSNDALIQELSADLSPVRRRSALREAGLLLALGVVELGLCLAFSLMRPDMGHMIGSTYMLWKLGSLMILAGFSGTIALRSFSPGTFPRRGVTVAIALAGAAMIAGLFVPPAAQTGSTLLDRLAPVHGLFCALAIVILSLPMLAMLATLMRRGAPVHPERSALSAGLAAGTAGAFVFAFCCPINDPLYIVVWYFVGCTTVATAARWLLPRRFSL